MARQLMIKPTVITNKSPILYRKTLGCVTLQVVVAEHWPQVTWITEIMHYGNGWNYEGLLDNFSIH